jgi:hypothetical protein
MAVLLKRKCLNCTTVLVISLKKIKHYRKFFSPEWARNLSCCQRSILPAAESLKLAVNIGFEITLTFRKYWRAQCCEEKISVTE